MIEGQNSSTPVNIIVAHALEAKALLPMLRLERDQNSTEFVQYRNAKQLQLLVAGMGKASMADAVSYLAERQANDYGEIRAWLNIGIAGHRDVPLGSGWLGNKITDQRSGSSAYPPQLVTGFQVGRVVTVDEPETRYPLDAAYDMEASAFYAEATRYSTAELVQVYKIISDNLANPISEIDLHKVPSLISSKMSLIVSLIEALGAIATQYNSCQELPGVYHATRARLRLNVNQQLQFKRLCQRYKALGREAELTDIAVVKSVEPRQLIQLLTEQLETDSEVVIHE